MSETLPPSALPASRPTRSPAPGSRPPGRDRGVPVAARSPGRSAPEKPSPRERLVGLGISEPAARELLAEHGRVRVVDALDALDTLGEGTVRRRAGWVVSALRQGWDLGGLLAERRRVEARHARWERERAERDRTAARWRVHQSTVGGWRAVVSMALDDQQLAVAVDRISTPVAGLGRRSVPVVRAQLVAWAVNAHRAAPGRLLSEVLADDLTGPDRRVVAPPLDGPFPSAPGQVRESGDDLTDRLTRLLERRPDLAHPGTPTHERADDARSRALGEGVGHAR